MALRHVPKNRARYLLARIRRVEKILKSSYRALVVQDSMNYSFYNLPRPKIQVIEGSEKLQCLQIEDVRFYWPREYSQAGLTHIYREVFAPSQANPHAYEIGSVQIHPGDWVIDAGACEGFFTHYALRRGANVLAVEPVPRLAQALAQTFAKEIEAGRVRILQAGFGPERSEMNLSVPEDEVYNASLSQTGTVRVPVYKLDDILALGLVPKINFLKMDIEGFETEVFQGAKELLNSTMPNLSVAVYHALENAQVVRSQILAVQPKYQVSWRGVFLPEDSDAARPYMLHAYV